jgi:hypothetical protein
MSLNSFISYRPSTKASHKRQLNLWLSMASAYRRATDECAYSTPGDWVGWAAGEVLLGSPFPSASLQTVRDTFASHRFPVIYAETLAISDDTQDSVGSTHLAHLSALGIQSPAALSHVNGFPVR